MRKKVLLICPECLSRNYTTTKKTENNSTRLEIKKFCPKCGKHTLHKEYPVAHKVDQKEMDT